ncbi:uncharacterized protein LOC128953942 [Oppia nitens]|uniref:uncharacterized protein LOC128953942 n=1 Tax=Oppia nitens TaxID=1686743 RepID=UPI0023DBBF0A|nr:uncharacterized protein LOC128953942 [Oppia nitens]XP_054155464.1 uncharacterized protein LOC128953942 [Oppia nitens]
METLSKKKTKKTKPKFIDLTEEYNNEDVITTVATEDQSSETKPLINVNEYSDNRELPKQREATVNIDNQPSAPPEEDYQPCGLADDRTRQEFMAKVFAVIFAQKSLFCVLIAIFTYIPHLRKIYRKWVFDPLFLSSLIGVPLIVFVALLAISPSIRRRFAKTAFIIITASLSLLMSYAITQRATANAFLYSMGFSDFCDLAVIVGSKARRDFTKWRYIAITPTIMAGSSFLAPTLLQTSLNNTIWPSIVMTGLSTYLVSNTRPVIKYNDLELEPEEYVFAATQLYMHPERAIKHQVKSWFCGSNNERQQRNRNAYTSI